MFYILDNYDCSNLIGSANIADGTKTLHMLPDVFPLRISVFFRFFPFARGKNTAGLRDYTVRELVPLELLAELPRTSYLIVGAVIEPILK